MAEAERRAQALTDENAGLVLKLGQRPSAKQVHRLQRQVQALQRQLALCKARCEGHDTGNPTPEDALLGEFLLPRFAPLTVPILEPSCSPELLALEEMHA